MNVCSYSTEVSDFHRGLRAIEWNAITGGGRRGEIGARINPCSRLSDDRQVRAYSSGICMRAQHKKTRLVIHYLRTHCTSWLSEMKTGLTGQFEMSSYTRQSMPSSTRHICTLAGLPNISASLARVPRSLAHAMTARRWRSLKIPDGSAK